MPEFLPFVYTTSYTIMHNNSIVLDSISVNKNFVLSGSDCAANLFWFGSGNLFSTLSWTLGDKRLLH